MIFEELLNSTLETHYINYRDNAYISLVPYLDDLLQFHINKITNSHLKALQNKIFYGLKKSASTTNNVISIIYTCYKSIENYNGHIPHVKRLPTAKNRLIREPMTKELFDIYKNYALEHDKVLYNILIIGMNTLLRIGEIREIEPEDINFSKGYVDIPITKNKRPHRVYINEDVKKALSDLMPDMLLDYSYFQLYYKFVKAETAVAKILEDNPHITPHSMRHGGITEYLSAGVPLPVVRDMANQSSVAITNLYTHKNEKAMRQAVQMNLFA